MGDTTLTDSPFYWLDKDGVRVLVAEALEAAGFTNGFSTRLGGVSPFPENDLNLAGFGEDTDENIAENRKRFLNALGGNYRLTTVWQIHSASVKSIKTESDVITTEDEHDGLVSNLKGVLVGVKTADCVPVLIGDPQRRAFAAIHAGWRGTAESIVQKALARMTYEFGSKPDELIVAIGPAAGCERYEIGQDVIDTFAKNFSTSGNLFKETRPGHALIDLNRANSEQLVAAGVNPKNISIAPFCTMERSDLFFSYRLEKARYGKTGRLMSVIGRKN
ncbi:MAG: peptidoglycan editing factor PgeF [Acidobacteriota bacterium]|nr:peptidoglycan editing factor PgeF [Acidobacteriota bacterium]MDH3530327.1 peptidoglycan editing factor PgeF [Acidobacteriota bacterium]